MSKSLDTRNVIHKYFTTTDRKTLVKGGVRTIRYGFPFSKDIERVREMLAELRTHFEPGSIRLKERKTVHKGHQHIVTVKIPA